MGIFSFQEMIVDQAVNLITSSSNQTAEVLGNIMSAFNPINDGAWIGQGAEAFKAEVLTEIVPGLADLINAINAANSLAKEVQEEIHAADDFLSALFGFVEDVFDAITPW
jgi:uncharacterized protein YukE